MSATLEDIHAAVAAGDYARLVAAIPYAEFLGLRVEIDAADARASERIYVMAYRDELVGNAQLPALHGGTVAGLLEMAMQLEVLIAESEQRLPYPVDFTIDYWRSAGPADCRVACRLIRSGRHIAQVQAECWQADRERPIAFARADFLLRSPD
ncbi:MAG: PaaI family thioesterase [Salinisphaera sp.]|jgi:uncharacterized protein (TIGR00369 family)|nr:PaaI family thioesterase [Salinisphaera sp.]